MAATRAHDLLVIGTADVVNKRGGGPSVFLREMFGDDLHAAADSSQVHVAEVESRAGAAPGPRERLSFSRLAYFLQCPLRYKYAVIYGMEMPGPGPVYFGANVHRALEEIHNRARAGNPPGQEEVAAIVAAVWAPGPQAQKGQEQSLQHSAIEQLRRYVRQYAATFPRIKRAETHFSFPLQECVLLGKIDLIRQDEDGGVEIVDFKTSRASLMALEGIDTQLNLYALGAEEDLKEQVSRQAVHFLVDDIFLCAFAVDEIRRQTGSEEILIENWEGEAAIIPLVEEILEKEKELIGEELEKILWYTGCDHLLERNER